MMAQNKRCEFMEHPLKSTGIWVVWAAYYEDTLNDAEDEIHPEITLSYPGQTAQLINRIVAYFTSKQEAELALENTFAVNSGIYELLAYEHYEDTLIYMCPLRLENYLKEDIIAK